MGPFLVPVYNCADSLRACLDSILAQTVQDFELICCDDGSTDDSLKILREYEKKDSRIKVLVHAANQNAGIARFNLIDAAQAEYSVFVDSDDTIAPDFLEQANHLLQTEERYDIVEFPFKVNDLTGKGFQRNQEKNRVLHGRDCFNFFLYVKYEPWLLWSKVIRTSLLKSIPQHRMRLRYFNDHLLCLALYYFAQSYRFYDSKHPLYFYNFGAGGWGKKNYSFQEIQRFLSSIDIVLNENLSFIRNYGISVRDERFFVLNKCDIYHARVYLIGECMKSEDKTKAFVLWHQYFDQILAHYK